MKASLKVWFTPGKKSLQLGCNLGHASSSCRRGASIMGLILPTDNLVANCKNIMLKAFSLVPERNERSTHFESPNPH